MNKSPNEAEALFFKMIKGIKDAGSTFCQYRACNLTIDTIYDLENIQNGVVYARTPLKMNDPFDSMIGFSTEKLYQDFCNMIVSIIPNEMTKIFMDILLKEKAIGKVAEFISTIKLFQGFLRAQKSKMSPSEPRISSFAIRHRNILFKKMSPALRKKIGNIQAFSALAFFTADVDLSMITEENLLQMIQVNSAIVALLDKFDEVKNRHYIPQFKDFLSKITVSCFSASGWDNQLMWSHYANSYSGICIEYDFSTVDGTTGFVFPVKYSQDRPTVSLKDLGFSIKKEGNKLDWNKDRIDVKTMLDYLLVKNTCWEYEKEWRIINIGQKDTPIFINMPKIKSITLGLHLDTVCKHLLLDICRDKKIPCYTLVLDTEKFALTRDLIDVENIDYNMDDELSYVNHISEHIIGTWEKVREIDEKSIYDAEAKYFNSSKFFSLLTQINDTLFHIYCLKKVMNSFMRYADDTVSEETFKELRNTVKQIDEGILLFNIHPDELINSFKIYLQVGMMSLDAFKRAKATLETNKALHEKISAIPWDSRIKPEETLFEN